MKKTIHPIDAAAKLFGSKTELAARLNVSKQVIYNWQLTKVPAERCLDIEELTNGAITCEQLRPDLNWSVLRNAPKVSNSDKSQHGGSKH